MKNIKKLIINLILLNLFALNSCLAIVNSVEIVKKTETMCDRVYAIEMEKVLSEIKSMLTKENQLNAAKNYMVLIKQREDISDKIQELERKILPTPIISKLRIPMNQYSRCKMGITTYPAY